MFVLLLIVAGSILGALTFGLVFFLHGKLLERTVSRAVDGHALVLRTGRVWLDVALDGYRRPGVMSSRRGKGVAGEVVLTEGALFAFVPFEVRVGDEDLANVTVTSTREHVTATTTRPPGATGGVNVTWPADKPARWVEALVARGAKRT